jgi:protein-S-isoprenylcysteine O-methyltransferase Ste14
MDVVSPSTYQPSVVGPLVKSAIGILVSGAAVAALLLGVSGRIDWITGWVFVIFWIVSKLGLYIYLSLLRPALLRERVDAHQNTQPFDKVIIPIYFVFGFGAFLVAGLDHRYGWSAPMPVGLVLAGIVMYVIVNFIPAWVLLVNLYASNVARIQADRQQQVISGGPYRLVRHPMYASGILIWLSTPLFLESWWAMVPAALASLALIVRTAFEDRMLRRELPGYVEYAQNTRYRLIPGLW